MREIYQISNELLTLEIDAVGAELHSLHGVNGPANGWLWDGGTAWERRAPVCFPWCGRVKDGWYEEVGERFEAGIHGFLRDMKHDVVTKEDNSMTLRAESTPDTLARYPWRFCADTTHTLHENKVVTTVAVTNLDQRAMPAQIGFHTGIRCPFADYMTPEDYQLRFEREENAVEAICTGGLVSGETRPVFDGKSVVPVNSHMFDEDSICLTGLKSSWIQLEEIATGRAIRVGIDGYPCVLLWSAPDMPGFLCIEPWYGMPSCLDGGHTLWERPNTVSVEPGKVFSVSQTLELVEQ